jgi:hypothetical protein
MFPKRNATIEYLRSECNKYKGCGGWVVFRSVDLAVQTSRVIQERTRATFHRLPYTALPKLALQALVMESTKCLNYFPTAGGISKHYSPSMIITKQRLHYKKHCSVPFGACVQAPADSSRTNDQHPRTFDCIYLRHNNYFEQEDYNEYSIQTARIIANVMHDLNQAGVDNNNKNHSFVQAYSLII